MAIGLSHGGSTIYSSPSPSQEVLVGTADGAVAIERDAGGPGWHVAHRALVNHHISAIIMEPESGLTFAGAYHGSIHASADGGRTWERRGNGLAERNVGCLASVRLPGGVRLYAGTEPAHLFCSDDLGLNWRELPALRSVPLAPRWFFPGPPFLAHTKHITFDPVDPNTLYVSIEVGGLLKSVDSGESWEELPGMCMDVHRAVINPRNPKHIYTPAGPGPRPQVPEADGGQEAQGRQPPADVDGLWASLDGGTTWEQLTDKEHEIGGYVDGLVLHPRQPEVMFIGASLYGPRAWLETHSASARISRSTDSGRTWEVLLNGLPDRLQSSIEALCLEDWGESCSVFAGTTGGELFCSDDGGDHWSLIISGLAPISKAGHFKALVRA